MNLWSESYRPKCIDDVILPAAMKTLFRDIVKSGDIPNMIFSGNAGVGKTTVAKALCEELNCSYMVIAGSETNGIDVIRQTVRSFASTVALDGRSKVVVFDEADRLTPSAQDALKGFLEEFADVCRFIFTCNAAHKLIPPLHSRCNLIEFRVKKSELPELQVAFFNKLKVILEENSIEYDDATILSLITMKSPDWRSIITAAHAYSKSGRIDVGILADMSETSFKQLVGYLRDKNFKETRRWVVENSDLDASVMIRKLYDNAYEFVQPSHIPHLIVILDEWQKWVSFVADQEIHTVTSLVEVMNGVEFKP